jgi:hypothetical protein
MFFSVYKFKYKSYAQNRIVLNNKEWNYTANFEFLGINIIENIRWKCYIKSLYQTLYTSLYITRSLRGVVGKPILRNKYFAKVQSVLIYGIIFWGVKCESIKVFKLQKRALPIIKGVKKYSIS